VCIEEVETSLIAAFEPINPSKLKTLLNQIHYSGLVEASPIRLPPACRPVRFQPIDDYFRVPDSNSRLIAGAYLAPWPAFIAASKVASRFFAPVASTPAFSAMLTA